MGYGYGSGTTHYDDATSHETGKRVRKTFDNGMLAHVWAQNSQTFGQSSNGNFYFIGPILHSYGSHFVVGVVMADGAAFLNSKTYSISTTQHQSDASAAVRGNSIDLPDLTPIAEALANSQQPEHKADLARYRDRLKAHFSTEDGCGNVDNMARALVYCGASPKAAMRTALVCERKAARIEAKRKAKNASNRRTLDLREAKDIAARGPDHYTRWAVETLGRYSGGTESYQDMGRNNLRESGRKAFRAAKAAKARGWAGISTECRKVYNAIRAVLADADKVEALAYTRKRCRAAIETIRDATENGPPAVTAGNASDFEAHSVSTEWQELSRRVSFLGGSVYVTKALAGKLRVIAADAATQGREWAIEANAQRMREQAQARADWLSGEIDRLPYGVGRLSDAEGGALLRAKGVERDDSGDISDGTLQTSWAVDVPLMQAIRAFRFLKLCRDKGQAWEANGHTIRVGHFRIDSVSARGDFEAGCHSVNWTECERVAGLLGLEYLTGAAGALSLSKGPA